MSRPLYRLAWLLAPLLPLLLPPTTSHAACTDAQAVATARARVEAQCLCASAVQRSAYLACARLAVHAAVTDGTLPATCAASVKKCTSQSTCGKPGYVTCLRPIPGGTRCQIKRNAAVCTAVAGTCVGTTSFCCDAADGCLPVTTTTIPPTTTTTPATSTTSSTTAPPPSTTTTSTPPSTTSTTTLPPLVCTDPVLGLPSLGRVPVTVTAGSTTCGTATLASPPVAPFSGEVDDASGSKVSDLGTGCLYFGAGNAQFLPPGRVPDGGTLVLDVKGLNGTSAILGPSAGTGPQNCTLPEGSSRHCLNDNPGTDGAGACAIDTDCGAQSDGSPVIAGTCAADAHCFFGPPMPVPVPDFAFFSTCVVSTFAQGACGAADLAAQTTTFSAGLSSRVYLTGNADSPCPRCVGGTCDAGKNLGLACQPVGTAGTTNDCPPDDVTYFGSLSVVLQSASTEPQEIDAPNGRFCEGQPSPGAFGRPEVTRIATHGSRLNPVALLSNVAAATIAAPFCIPPSGYPVLDAAGGFPAPGAVSVPVKIDLGTLIGLGLPPLLP